MVIRRYKKGSNKQLSKDFNVREFECHCMRPGCETTLVDDRLVQMLQEKRNEFGKQIFVVSGYRCYIHNKEVGGEEASKHMLGQAADIIVEDMTVDKLADACENFTGLGRYPDKGFVHVDVRSGNPARWER